MKNLFMPLLAGATISFCACQSAGNGDKKIADSSSNVDNTAVKPDTPAVSQMDTTAGKMNNQPPLDTKSASFMMKVANVGMTEVELGQLAQQNASSQRVKDFGSMMVRDHTAAGNSLKQLAGTKNVTLPMSLDDKSKKHKEDLSKKMGAAFDRDYMKMMVEGHKQTIKDFQDIESTTKDPDVKAFVSNTLPTLKMHLDSAQSISKSLKY